MKKIAIIGASYLQLPLIKKAKILGYVTHVFAWKTDDAGEKEADFFYPISIVEKERILSVCEQIKIDGICSIASDLAVITVNYVAQKMGFVHNSEKCVLNSTNKFYMRKALEKGGVPIPTYLLADENSDWRNNLRKLKYPVIVKPTDRSGSRGITKVYCYEGMLKAVSEARNISFENKAVIEEFVEGKEYSVEGLSWEGKHTIISITEKYTTGEPRYVEIAHFEPADIESDLKQKVCDLVIKALDSLNIEYGASHTEIKINESREVKVIEVGARMGGDMIGSVLVYETTGFDYIKGVIDIALGLKPVISIDNIASAAIRYITNKSDLDVYREIKEKDRNLIINERMENEIRDNIESSADRTDFFIIKSREKSKLKKYLPNNK